MPFGPGSASTDRLMFWGTELAARWVRDGDVRSFPKKRRSFCRRNFNRNGWQGVWGLSRLIFFYKSFCSRATYLEVQNNPFVRRISTMMQWPNCFLSPRNQSYQTNQCKATLP